MGTNQSHRLSIEIYRFTWIISYPCNPITHSNYFCTCLQLAIIMGITMLHDSRGWRDLNARFRTALYSTYRFRHRHFISIWMTSLPTAFSSGTYMGTLSTCAITRNVGKHCPDYLVPWESLSTSFGLRSTSILIAQLRTCWYLFIRSTRWHVECLIFRTWLSCFLACLSYSVWLPTS